MTDVGISIGGMSLHGTNVLHQIMGKKPRKKKPAATKSSEAAASQPVGEPVQLPAMLAYAKAERAYEKYKNELLKLEPVTAVSVGHCYRGGQKTGQFGIRLHVATAADKAKLKELARVGQIELKKSYDGVPIDIISGGFELATAMDGDALFCDGRRGTLGTVVQDLDANTRWLTAAHLASKTVSISADAQITDGSGLVVGTVPALPPFYVRNDVADAALVVPSSPQPAPPSGRGVRNPSQADIANGTPVTMHGSSTPSAIGFIDSLSTTGLPLASGEVADDHFLVKAHFGGNFAIDGDSGSAVWIGNDLVGVVRAANMIERFTVCCKIINVLGYLQFRL